MLLTLALVVLFCSIAVMFSQEIGNFFKKIFAIPGMKLLLPLIVVSLLVVYYEPWVFWGLLHIKTILHTMAATLANWLPFEAAALFLANVIILMGLSILPVLAINIWIKRKSFESFRYSFLTTTIIWIVVAVLLTVSYSY